MSSNTHNATSTAKAFVVCPQVIHGSMFTPQQNNPHLPDGVSAATGACSILQGERPGHHKPPAAAAAAPGVILDLQRVMVSECS
jgi:hypothetical protein